MQELATGYGLIEAPIWDPAKELYFSDVLAGGIYLLDRVDGVQAAVPKRCGVGGLARSSGGAARSPACRRLSLAFALAYDPVCVLRLLRNPDPWHRPER